MDACGTGLLRNAADVVLHLLAGHHHQVGQLINNDGDVGHVLQRRVLGGQLVVGLDLADVVLRKQLVAALHLRHRGSQRTRGLAGFGDHRHEQVRDAVVFRQLHHLGVDEDELHILGAGTEQEADDDGVDAHRLAAAGGTGDEQVGHLAQVRHLRRAGNVLAEGHGEGRTHVDVVLGLEHGSDTDGGTYFIGHLDAHRGLAGDGRLDAYPGGGKVEGDVIRQRGDAADLDARLRLQLVPGHRGTAADIQYLGLDAKAVQRIHQNVGVFLHLLHGPGLVLRAGGVEQVQRRIAVGLGRLFEGRGQRGGLGAHFGGAGRAGNGRRGGVAHLVAHLQAGGLPAAGRGGGRPGRSGGSRHAGQHRGHGHTGVPCGRGGVKVLLVKAAADGGNRRSGLHCLPGNGHRVPGNAGVKIRQGGFLRRDGGQRRVKAVLLRQRQLHLGGNLLPGIIVHGAANERVQFVSVLGHRIHRLDVLFKFLFRWSGVGLFRGGGQVFQRVQPEGAAGADDHRLQGVVLHGLLQGLIPCRGAKVHIIGKAGAAAGRYRRGGSRRRSGAGNLLFHIVDRVLLDRQRAGEIFQRLLIRPRLKQLGIVGALLLQTGFAGVLCLLPVIGGKLHHIRRGEGKKDHQTGGKDQQHDDVGSGTAAQRQQSGAHRRTEDAALPEILLTAVEQHFHHIPDGAALPQRDLGEHHRYAGNEGRHQYRLGGEHLHLVPGGQQVGQIQQKRTKQIGDDAEHAEHPSPQRVPEGRAGHQHQRHAEQAKGGQHHAGHQIVALCPPSCPAGHLFFAPGGAGAPRGGRSAPGCGGIFFAGVFGAPAFAGAAGTSLCHESNSLPYHI